ncbi:hypothetical protein EYF80_046570 [Liparis tanakae]|uniref:Uncharacterized protein n=1 Tax=Liparis tanakae TaxID=230148 RepID=A0A4Z2FRB3_9TELE|nr:hypothetical protein EYF80_046570 [Liparis tanakae]
MSRQLGLSAMRVVITSRSFLSWRSQGREPVISWWRNASFRGLKDKRKAKTSNIEWGQIDPKGHRRVNRAQAIYVALRLKSLDAHPGSEDRHTQPKNMTNSRIL